MTNDPQRGEPAGEWRSTPALEALARSSPLSLIRYDRQGRITFVSPNLLEYFGLSGVALVGKLPREVWPDGRFARIEAGVSAALETGAETVVEMVEPGPRGEPIHHEIRVVAERDESGAITGAWGFGDKVTALRRAERDAEEHAAVFRSLSESSPEMIARIDAEGRVAYCNPAVLRAVALGPAFLGARVGDALGGGRGGLLLEATVMRVLKTGVTETVEVQLPTREGTAATHEIIVVAERPHSGDRRGVLCLGRDITVRRRLERELREVLRVAHGVVIHSDVVAGTGWSPEDPERTEDRLVWNRSFESEALAEAVLPLDVSDRTYLEAWECAVPPDDRLRKRRMAAVAFATGATTFHTEFRAVDRDGHTHWFEQVASIEPIDVGRWRVTSIDTDVTKARVLEDELRQTQKMEALGQLAGGVAHDFNNIIGAIMMQVHVLDLEEHLSSDAREILRELQESADRAARLVRQLLTFSRKRTLQAQNQDLNAIVAGFETMLRRYLREDVVLELELSRSPLVMHCDAGMVEQVLMNLGSNASDAMPNGGCLRVQTCAHVLDRDESFGGETLAAGDYACLCVTDTGTGIPDEVLPRIFDPFFTTKDVGKGTGLGLATVFGIVKQHGGAIRVRTAAGRGTTFEVLWPRVRESRAPVLQPAPTSTVEVGTGRVLLVEDEAMMRSVTRMLLVRAGYQVYEAQDGLAALQIWNAHAGEIDVLLTDVIMPGGVNGRELANLLLERDPRLRVIFLSGYTREVVPLPTHGATEVFLSKPCSGATLLKTLRTVMGRGRAS
ncbi:MAG: PAS domain-containing protein [Sandaracinaceae bacterium]|nr:PAS domain-containing protein [Sandaracinaceae bacterium]